MVAAAAPPTALELLGDQEAIERQIERSIFESDDFKSSILALPEAPELAPKSKAREVFDHFSSGDTIEFPQARWRLVCLSASHA